MSQDAVNHPEADGTPRDLDTIFSVLSRERRRYALYCLEEYHDPLSLADLADEVARLEHDERTVAEIPASEVKSIYMSLYHTHVPQMVDAGVVAYDQDTDSVRLKREIDCVDLEKLV